MQQNENRSKRTGWVVAGLLLGILMAAMDNTVVATSTATIVSELGGFDKFIWVTSAYMVAMMAGTPIFGKLSDMYGRKRFFVLGLGLFLLGSILCGTAQSMIQLSLYRAIQGVGGGALMPIAFTIAFDLFPPQQRGKVGGLFGAAFGLSSIFGPLLGAYITETIDWRWVFYINLPLGVLSFLLIAAFYKESLEHAKQRIDWWGAATLVGAVVSLMFALELGGNSYAWDSFVILGLFVAFAVLLAAFLYIETKAPEPIVSFAMFKQRLFAASNAVSLFIGMTFIAATVYIPIFIQGVLGGSVTNAGLILTPMMLGSVAGSQLGGFLTTKISYRSIMLGASVFFLTGIALLGTLTPDTARSFLTACMVVTGFGVGFSFSVLTMAAIHPFDMRQRGSASSTNRFMINLGTALGITVFGILQRNSLMDRMQSAFAGSVGAGSNGFAANTQRLLTPEGRANLPKEALDAFANALSSSIAHTFEWALVPAVLAVLCIFMMTGDKLQLPAKAGKRSAEGANAVDTK